MTSGGSTKTTQFKLNHEDDGFVKVISDPRDFRILGVI